MHATAADRLSHVSKELAALFESVRRTTVRLCTPLSAEDQVIQSMPDASPAKWHQGHTTWFFETFLLTPHWPGYQSPDSRYRFFFNSYYKQLGGHPIRAQRGLWSRPSLAEIQAYRQHVDQQMLRWLRSGVDADLVPLVELGCHHEQQHQELILTDIKHALWTNPLRPPYRDRHRGQEDAMAAVEATPLSWHNYDGGLRWVGHGGNGFSFDNESARHRVYLQPFRLASRLVTVGEYLEFMRDGGYSRPELWLSEGWDTVNAQGWRAPLYWESETASQANGNWLVYTLNGQRLMNPAEPVCHVSYFEADAYARWAGARLATEFEWEVAASQLSNAAPPARHFGECSDEESLPSQPNLLDCDRLHPVPAPGNGDDFQQLFGDVWEWTASQYLPYPGFSPAAGVVGEYNGKFMCNQFVLRGGSCATPANHIRATYRNFFPPAARWQFTGIRLAHD